LIPNKPFHAPRHLPALPPPARSYLFCEDANAPDAKALADEIVARRRAERHAMLYEYFAAIPHLLAVRGDLY